MRKVTENKSCDSKQSKTVHVWKLFSFCWVVATVRRLPTEPTRLQFRPLADREAREDKIKQKKKKTSRNSAVPADVSESPLRRTINPQRVHAVTSVNAKRCVEQMIQRGTQRRILLSVFSSFSNLGQSLPKKEKTFGILHLLFLFLFFSQRRALQSISAWLFELAGAPYGSWEHKEHFDSFNGALHSFAASDVSPPFPRPTPNPHPHPLCLLCHLFC